MKKTVKMASLILLFVVSYVLADQYIMYKNTRIITGQATASSTAPAIPIPTTRTTNRRAVDYCNDGANKVYIGSSSAVTSTTGHLLPAGACISFEVNPLTNSTTFFFATNAGSSVVTFMELAEPTRP